jgi:transcriptional regulator with XRE-family HTH domain
VKKDPDLVSDRVSSLMLGISTYLTGFRAREELTQNGMAGKLGLSLNRYREYEQNTTDNAKGISLELLIRISNLEKFELCDFFLMLERINLPESNHTENSFNQSEFKKCPEIEIHKEYIQLPMNERLRFSNIVFQKQSQGEPLMPKMLRWILKMSVLLAQLSYADRLKIERDLIEEVLKKDEVEDKAELLDRLKELIKFYYTNFDSLKK